MHAAELHLVTPTWDTSFTIYDSYARMNPAFQSKRKCILSLSKHFTATCCCCCCCWLIVDVHCYKECVLTALILFSSSFICCSTQSLILYLVASPSHSPVCLCLCWLCHAQIHSCSHLAHPFSTYLLITLSSLTHSLSLHICMAPPFLSLSHFSHSCSLLSLLLLSDLFRCYCCCCCWSTHSSTHSSQLASFIYVNRNEPTKRYIIIICCCCCCPWKCLCIHFKCITQA